MGYVIHCRLVSRAKYAPTTIGEGEGKSKDPMIRAFRIFNTTVDEYEGGDDPTAVFLDLPDHRHVLTQLLLGRDLAEYTMKRLRELGDSIERAARRGDSSMLGARETLNDDGWWKKPKEG